MHILTTTLTILHTIAFTTAVDVCAYTFLRACIMQSSCCTNVPAGVCCHGWPSNFGYSINWLNPPPRTVNWLGRIYAEDACINMIGGGNGCSGVCNTCVPSRSASWGVTSREANNASASKREGECVKPDVVRFVDEDGVHREVAIPDGAFDEVHALLSAGNYTALLNI